MMVATCLDEIVKTPQELQKIAIAASQRNAELAESQGIDKMNHHPYATILIQDVSKFVFYLSTWCPSTKPSDETCALSLKGGS
jgi:ABC-type antimicrobial peptide transport system ATPase subunit